MRYADVIVKMSQFARKSKALHSIFVWLNERICDVMSLLPDNVYASIQYYIHTRKKLNIKNPSTFNECLWWLKFHYHDPLQTQCADKYLVREYVSKQGYENLLPKLFAVYENAKDINFSIFHKETFIKCNHGSGTNRIYNPNCPFDIKEFQRTFSRQLKKNAYRYSREWVYKDIKPRIVCEQVLRDKAGRLPMDYKFFCFHGTPKLMAYEANVCGQDGRHSVSDDRFVNFYDMDFKFLPIISGTRPNSEMKVEKPISFDYMKTVATNLSKPFPFCRVDLYLVDDIVYFGEMTFYHGGGCIDIEPEEWSLKMGEWIRIGDVKEIE